MTLELTQVVSQIEQAVQNLRESARERGRKLEAALGVMRDQESRLDRLKEKLKAARTSWLVAGLAGGLCRTHPLPALPADHGVLAVDGSNIDLDRHSALSCYLLNMGLAYLAYGASPEARLESYARLYSAPDDLVIKDPANGHQEQRMDAVLLGIRRAVEEVALASRILRASPPWKPTLALFDGTLVLFGLVTQAFPDYIVEMFLKKGFLGHLDELSRISMDKPVAVASYISYPGGAEVVNVLRVAVCPFSAPDCDHHCGGPAGPAERQCASVSGIPDRTVFERLLQPGERSELFCSTSKVTRHYGRHLVHFFYLNTGEEIGRVEIPEWVAENRDLLDLAHAAIYDQCQRGRGYPIALQEAHEKAVVTVADREAFRSLIARELMEDHIHRDTSLKNSSKRLRWL